MRSHQVLSYKSTAMPSFLYVLLMTLIAISSAQADELQISGFGSIVGGTVLSGDGYWARLPEGAGQYMQGLELMSESRLALQANYSLSEKFDLVGQFIARGHDQFEPKVAWLYGAMSLSSDRQLKVGRLRLPVYQYSDVMDVGVTYPWVRVPSDAYSLAVTEFDGVMLSQRWNWLAGSSKVTIYSGQRDTNPNQLITKIEQYKNEQKFNAVGEFVGLGDIHTTKFYRDMRGVVLENNIDWLTVRFSYLKGRENFTYYDVTPAGYKPRFGDVWLPTRFLDSSVQLDLDNWSIIAEWNYYQKIYKSWFMSFAYQAELWTPYVYMSGFKGTQRWAVDPIRLDDHYQSTGVGVRYDLAARIALKTELTFFSDKGDAPVFIDRNHDGDTDASAIAVSVDFSF